MLLITSQRLWWQLDLVELWSCRELLRTLIARDIKVRYKQTWLGVSWAILQPLLAAGIFTLFFSRLLSTELTGEINYGAFVLTGFVFWQFFSGALTTASTSLAEQIGLLGKVYFPRLFLPLTVIGRCLFDFSITFICLIVVLTVTGTPFYWLGLLWSLLCLVSLTLLLLGLVAFFSALNVKYRDVKHILPFLIQIGLFISPVFYSDSILPKNLQWLGAINPLAVILNLIRQGLFSAHFDWASWGIISTISLLIAFGGLVFFKNNEQHFVDIA